MAAEDSVKALGTTRLLRCGATLRSSAGRRGAATRAA